ncbi:MAG: phage tail protein [Leisingera sp.]
MAGLQEQATWENEVYQIEQQDPVLGGPPDLAQGQGHTNVPHLHLANRTLWLKQQVDALLSQIATKMEASEGGNFFRNDQLNVFQSLGGLKQMRAGWGASNNKMHFTARLLDDSGWDYGTKFGYDADTREWFFDTPPTIAGNLAYHVGDKATLEEAIAGSDNARLMTPLRVKQFYNDRINALLDGAPAALDTLKELADAIGDNDSELAALVVQIGSKVDTSTFNTQIAAKLDAAAFTAAAVLALLDGERIKSGGAWIEGGEFLWENGVNRLSSNDGNGNVQIRMGHDSDENFTHDGTAFYIGGNQDNASGSLTIKVASNGGAGAGQSVSWGAELEVTEDGISFDGVSLVAPAGTIIAFAGGTPPPGWFECDGSTVSRTTYDKLFASIGTTYGNGNGSTNYNLPDLRGEFLRGWDNGRGVDSGRALGSFQSDELKAHKHVQTGASGSGGNLTNYSAANSTSDTSTTLNNQTKNTGGSETRPRNVAVMYCIKY